jgi:hypothetical protein
MAVALNSTFRLGSCCAIIDWIVTHGLPGAVPVMIIDNASVLVRTFTTSCLPLPRSTEKIDQCFFLCPCVSISHPLKAAGPNKSYSGPHRGKNLLIVTCYRVFHCGHFGLRESVATTFNGEHCRSC